MTNKEPIELTLPDGRKMTLMLDKAVVAKIKLLRELKEKEDAKDE